MRFTGLYLLLFILPCAQAQDNYSYRLGFYNVENLFHPDNDSLTNDDEFTPEGMRYWSFYKYRDKYHRTAKVILSMADEHPVDVLGLAEVENEQVLRDMVYSRVLSKLEYAIIHKNSPDRRGIDVAAIYRPERVKVLDTNFIRLHMPDDPGYASRDMLHLKVLLRQTADTLHLVFCHWPSRYGGQAISEPKRIQAAKILRRYYDSIVEITPHTPWLIAGDFNDEYFNQSLWDQLMARPLSDTAAKDNSHLYNLMAELPAQKGSHRYQGEWTYLDQLIVNAPLLHRIAGFGTIEHSFLMENDSKYPGVKPFRTFVGMKYHGGFSDHLPIYVDLHYPKVKTQP